MASASDDFYGDINTTGSIAIGGTAKGVLETSGDSDWFKVTLEAGTTYQFALTSSGAVPGMQFYTATGAYAAGYTGQLQAVAGGQAPVDWFKASVSGDYYLAVSGYTVGAYSVHATALAKDDYTDVPHGATTLALGGKVSGSIELPGDHDVFQMTLEAGKTYTLTASGAADASGTVALPVVGFYSAAYGTSASPVHVTGTPDGAASSFTPTTSGVYYAVASDIDQAHGHGGYTVQLSAAADDYAANAGGAGTLTVGGGAVGGVLNVQQDLDWFKVSLQANQSYTFSLGDASNHSVINIVDAQGTVLSGYAGSTVAGVGETLYWTPPRDGDYYVQVQAQTYYGGTAPPSLPAYTLQASATPADDFSGDTGTTGLLGVGQTLTGKMETIGDVDWIKVKMQAGTSYLFDLSSATLPDGSHPAMDNFVLMNSSGYQVVYSTASGSDKALSYLAPTSGDYYLAVSGPVSAGYSVTSYAPVADDISGDATTTATLAAGGVVHGVIGTAGDHDWYQVTVASGQYASFELDGAYSHSGSLGSDGSGTSLVLHDATGKVISSSNGGNYSEASLYGYNLSAGTYYVDVSSTGIGTGSYVLKESGPNGMPDTTPPVVSSVTGPASTGGLTGNIVLNFNESIQLGSGTINLSTAAGKLVESFDVASSSHLTATNSELSIDPSADLLPNTDYVLTLTAGSVKDAAGNVDYATSTQTFHTIAAPDKLVGTGGNDIFHASSGGGSIDGGAGLDTVVFSGRSYTYYISTGTLATSVANNYVSGSITESLTSVERLRFDDMDIAYDTRGTAGEVYRLYQAAFGRTPDSSGLGYWIHAADGGVSLHDVAVGFMQGSEFTNLYGAAPTDLAFLTNLYQNVLHRAPDQGGIDYWSAQLQHGAARADVLTSFSESPENQIALFPAIQNGINFTHFIG